MSQPDWKCVAQLGDVNPIEYGGYWVFIDQTGVYPPEAELLISPEDETGEYHVYRFCLDRCTFIDGILSDNPHHPDKSVWFADSVPNIASCAGTCADPANTIRDFVADLCSDDPIKLASAYRCIGEFHGFANLDSYPLTLSHTEAEERYGQSKYQECK